jgi:hypothetical protein
MVYLIIVYLNLVRRGGFEPPCLLRHQILSLARLPVPPPSLIGWIQTYVKDAKGQISLGPARSVCTIINP